jgi:hypothetical protein
MMFIYLFTSSFIREQEVVILATGLSRPDMVHFNPSKADTLDLQALRR